MARGALFERDVFHLGDCAQMDALPDDAIDLVVAGPPYWNCIDYPAFARGEPHFGRAGAPYDAFLAQFTGWFREVFRVLRPGRYCVVNLGTVRAGERTIPLPFHAVQILEGVGFQFSWEIVWHKPAGGRRTALGFLRRPLAGDFAPNNVSSICWRSESGPRFRSLREASSSPMWTMPW